ncbi:MAG: hypothetical protein C6W57_13780 [Caldibacillus debilis]|nr:MAG: hypothetical protein C6W57_13780 [Caldibacillus debilis]
MNNRKNHFTGKIAEKKGCQVKKFIQLFIFLSLVLLPSMALAKEEDGYAKYGRIATAVVREDYPGQPVTEYAYLGREELSGNRVQDRFRFELKENGVEKFVIVTVVHDLSNKKLLNLSVTEEMRNG